MVKLRGGEKRDKYLDLATELKTTMEHESVSDANCSCAKWLVQGLGESGFKRTSEDHTN